MPSYLKLFVDCLDKYQKLNDTEFGRLVRAALRYKATGAEPDNLGREALLWDGMRLDIDRDNENYQTLCDTRSEAGKKGAKSRWQNHSKNSKSHLPYGKNGQEEDKDKEEDKDNDKEEDKDNNLPPKSPIGGNDDVKKVVDAYEGSIGAIPRYVVSEALDFIASGIETPLVCRAIQISAENNVRKWSYAAAILRDCENKGITTLSAFEAESAAHKAQKAQPEKKSRWKEL